MNDQPTPLRPHRKHNLHRAFLVKTGTFITGIFTLLYTLLVTFYVDSDYAEGEYAWVHWFLTSGAHFLAMVLLGAAAIALHLRFSAGSRWGRIARALPAVAMFAAAATVILIGLFVEWISGVRLN